MTRFRYSPSKFWNSLFVALGLTAMVTGLTWMIFTRQGHPDTTLITATAGTVFLAFFSARMAYQYVRDDIVLAVLPTGIEDLRWGQGLIEWEKIKEITLARRENDFELNVHLWPGPQLPAHLPIDLNALESDVETVIAAISTHVPVREDF